ncbi:tetratricopeptide repeat protein [Laceyella sacchari]|jgi:tetratricopeptide (TPR) repeat protein|uniref:Helix-turn-helix transcriptional regulator n=1 Tax=Laceyella sacchari TaxID=37482 RepID=A0ABY5U0Q9_LACSH|nr:tetratricopeptide repeat protein [Laceyella sacchari]TCW38912.1 tetratricopeptide repeat protein [Laceyella sacchari]UWE03246.1 helix-turn-helix transcriptional regulator [Laceyella sacchari]
MNILEMSEVGKYIRKVRKERGLRLEDLSDQHISTATISNIERGVPHVNKDKVLYLMNKLGLDLSEVPDMIEKDTGSIESLQVRFTAIETMIQLGNYQRALALLSDLSDEVTSQHQATIHYLKGRIHFIKRDWRKAERELSEAIRLAYQDPYSPKVNLEAASYLCLSECRMQHKDWEQALKYVERGLDALTDEEEIFEQMHVKLLLARIENLQKLDRADEALRGVDEVWALLPQIRSRQLILQTYALRAELLRKMKLYQDAIRYAREGSQIAVGSKEYGGMFRLWSVLAHSYQDAGQLADAEVAFEFVLELGEHVNDKEDLVQASCSLGQVYLMQGKMEQARDILKQALDMAERIHHGLLTSTALILLGQAMKNMNHYLDAIEYFQSAGKIADKNKLKDRVYLCYYELADCYEKIGEEAKFQEATQLMYQTQKELNKNKLYL